MKVKELIEKLKTFDQDADVGLRDDCEESLSKAQYVTTCTEKDAPYCKGDNPWAFKNKPTETMVYIGG